MTQPAFDTTYAADAAQNYQRYFVPTIAAPLAADLLEAARLEPDERVLDVACGTGVVTRLAAKQVAGRGKAAGLDANAGMLAVARASTPPELAIEWYETTAEAIPLGDDSFDVALCQQSLQFFANRQAALREIRRILSPGGRLLVNVPGPKPALFAILGEALAQHIDARAAALLDVVFSLHDADELRDLMRSAGFAVVQVQAARKTLPLPPPAEFLWQYLHSTPLASMIAQAPASRRDALESHVVAGWQPFVVNGTLMLDLGITTVVAA